MAPIGGIEFDENQGLDPIPEPELRPPSFADNLLKTGIISKPGEAVTVLLIFAVLLIAASFYLLTSTIPPQPQLGGDTLRAGEAVPDYVK